MRECHCLLADGPSTLSTPPGFDDTRVQDMDALRELMTWLNKTYKQKVLLMRIVYLDHISDTRIGWSGILNLRMFKKLCGEKSMASVALTTNHEG